MASSSVIAWFQLSDLLFLLTYYQIIHLFAPHSLFSCCNLRGSGEDGQLGIGNNEEREWVCVVQALEPHNVRSVVAGSRNSLAICDDGKVSIATPPFCFYICLYIHSS